jgi:ribosome-binding protein aMBF1 (putative translation factor)
MCGECNWQIDVCSECNFTLKREEKKDVRKSRRTSLQSAERLSKNDPTSTNAKIPDNRNHGH